MITPPQSPIRNMYSKTESKLFDSPIRCNNGADSNLKLLLNKNKNYQLQKERRVTSLDSSTRYLTYRKLNSVKVSDEERRALSAESGIVPSQVMNRLSFENIDLLNTPLSSLKSCSEYNKLNNDERIAEDEKKYKQMRKSIWSKFYLWRSHKKSCEIIKSQERSPSLYTRSSVGENDQSIFDTLRLNPINLWEDEDLHSPSSSITKQKLRSKYNSNDSTSTFSHYEKNHSTISNYFYSGTTEAMDYLFGLHSRARKLPMEIELKNLKEPEMILSLSESERTLMEMRRLLNNMEGNESLNLMRRVTSLRSLERINSYSDTNIFNDNIQNINQVVNNVEVDFNIYNMTTWMNRINYLSVIIIEKLRNLYPLGRDDDFFYESIRIQPFSSGSYLRAMLVSGFSSLYINSYNLLSWPDFPEKILNLSLLHKCILQYLYVGLIIQIILNIIQLPFRLKIHYQCWESSRAIEVDSAIVTLRNMLLSDYWLISKSIGHLLDIMVFINTVLAEVYLWFCGGDDPLKGLIISLCATSLLALVVRIIVATIFSLSMHDPQVLSDARRRGLSKWDLEVLPAFVFTNLEEVNNFDSCSICLNNFSIGELLITLPCDKKHSFHSACIRQWLQRQNSCPLCQKLV